MSYIQGDPIGRIFAYWAIVLLFGRFLKITQVAQILRLPFQRQKLCINFDENLIGLHFGRFFPESIWSPWLYQQVGCLACYLTYVLQRRVRKT
jgi:hypothetical protein